jgi:hypothetical protein
MSRPVMHLTPPGRFEDKRLPLRLVRRKPQAPFPPHTQEFSEPAILVETALRDGSDHS